MRAQTRALTSFHGAASDCLSERIRNFRKGLRALLQGKNVPFLGILRSDPQSLIIFIQEKVLRRSKWQIWLYTHSRYKEVYGQDP